MTANEAMLFAAGVDTWADDVQADGGDGLRKFEMLAYTGQPISLNGWDKPVVVELAGVQVTEKARPILKDHDPSQIVGHTEQVTVAEEGITVRGIISGASTVAQEVISSSRNGFPWQASIGARAVKVKMVKAGKSVRVNGRQMEGPLYVVQKSVLGEVSFVALGADDATSARVAATQAAMTSEDRNMFDKWVEAQGFDSADLTDEQRASLKAAFDAQQVEDKTEAPMEAAVDVEAQVSELRNELAIEAARVRNISANCSGHGDIESKAIAEGWSAEKAELEVLRAERAVNSAPAGHVKSNKIDATTVEAALSLSAGLDENKIAAEYGDKVMDAAYPMRGIGLRELCAETAKMEGHSVPRTFGDGSDVIRASFSTMSLPGILENVMNKTMLSSYEAQSIVALDCCKISSVNDFKQVKRHRLLGTGAWGEVAPDGELTNAQVAEETYTNEAKTYGQMITLTRTDVINDDLNAFLEIPREMGRQGAFVIDDLFFKMWNGNTGSHFSAGNNNLLTGAGSGFDIAALSAAYAEFRKQKSGAGGDDRPINIRPEILLVPVELEIAAQQLIGSPVLMTGGGDDRPSTNPHSGKYRVLSSPLLSDSNYSGSATAWYLMANPSAMAAAELVFLNGKRTPTIERVDGAANQLVGMSFRGYLDVGVNFMDTRSAVKNAGA